MSSVDQSNQLNPNNPLYYAPRHLRDRPGDPRAARRPAETREAEFDPHAVADAQDETAWQQLPAEYDETPMMVVGRRATISKLFAGAGLIAAVAGSAFWIYPAAFGTQADLSNGNGGASFAVVQSAAADVSSVPKLVASLLAEDAMGESNEPLPLGIRVTALTSGATVGLSGLPAGARLTAGASSGAGQWRVSVNDLPVAAVIPPRDFAGTMSIGATLYETDGRVTGGKSVQLAWTPTGSKTVGAARLQTIDRDTTAKTEPVANAARKMSPAEIAALIKRGQELATDGDFPAARLLLQRAAEAHEPRAALALAATYDPVAIKRFTTSGAAPDQTLAEAWYQKAREWDSANTPRQGNALSTVAGR